MSEPVTPFVQRVILRNYKSIRQCDVSLGPLTLLVGPNGSGKSNFLDALRFVAESVRDPMERAFDKRGGLVEVLCRFPTPAEKLEISLQLNLTRDQTASFRFVVSPKPSGGFIVEEEDCTVEGDTPAMYKVREGKVIEATFKLRPPVSSDRLYLTSASNFHEFRGLYDLLARVLFYKINPGRIKQRPFAGRGALRPDGAGVGRVLRRIAIDRPKLKDRIDEYACAILPSLDRICVESLSEWVHRLGADVNLTKEMEKYFLLFVVRGTSNRTTYFSARNMSDGTLHSLGVLVALFQCAEQPPERVISLVGIEEPEATVHPAAAGVLFDALHEAAHFVQVVATTHSAELLDIKDVDPDSLLIVDIVDGETVIGPADEVTRSIMRDRLATAGELLRDRQLRAVNQASGPVGVETEND
ncbi:MAG: AAA family ATPase [Planctomycetes bacterium]|nr:AAA family ATPase [Planctomycetota bacterium]